MTCGLGATPREINRSELTVTVKEVPKQQKKMEMVLGLFSLEKKKLRGTQSSHQIGVELSEEDLNSFCCYQEREWGWNVLKSQKPRFQFKARRIFGLRNLSQVIFKNFQNFSKMENSHPGRCSSSLDNTFARISRRQLMHHLRRVIEEMKRYWIFSHSWSCG